MSDRLILDVIYVVLCAIAFGMFRRPTHSTTIRLLRRVAFSGMIVFVVSTFIMSHSALASMKRGDFWVFDLPIIPEILLPHPYDYCLNQIVRYSTFLSFIVLIVCFVLYRVRAMVIKANRLE